MGASRTLRAAAVVALLGAITATSLLTRPTRRPPSMGAEIAGCALVRDDGTCEVSPKSGGIRVRLATTSRHVEAHADGRRLSAKVTAEGDGVLVSLEIPPGAKELRLTTTDDEEEARLAVAMVDRAWLDEARAHRRAGELDEAERIAGAHATSTDGIERALAAGVMARTALSRGDVERAIELLQRSFDGAHAARLASAACEDACALTFTLARQRRRYQDARAALDRGADACATTAEGRADSAYYRGIIAMETGDARTALTSFRTGYERARRVGLEQRARHAENAGALTLMLLGRRTEALSILRRLSEEADSAPCDRADVASNVALGSVLANAAGDIGAPSVEDGAVAARDAMVLARRCSRAEVRSASLATWAQAALAAGNDDEARAAIDEARRTAPDADGTARLLWLDVEARVSLGAGDAAGALVRFDRERDLAAAALLPMQTWRSETGRAEALSSLGRLADAESALHDAEAVIALGGARVPLGEGRAGFLADRERSARLLVGVRLRRGDVRGAFQAARRAASRADTSAIDMERLGMLAPDDRARWDGAVSSYTRERAALDEAAAHDWEAPADDLARRVTGREQKTRALRDALDAALTELGGGLPAPVERLDPGDVVILAFPSMTGWIAFDDGPDGLHATPLDQPRAAEPTLLGDAVLTAVGPHLVGARRIRVIAYGALSGFDFHAAMFRGRPLIAQAPVLYQVGAAARSPTDHGVALVIADPTGDLPAARQEGRSAAGSLGAHGPVVLLEGDEALGPRVRVELAGARHAHIAAHAWFRGHDGWESSVALAAGGSIGVADVLASVHVPHTVVLSSCEAARRSEVGGPAGLSLAHAFALSGSRRVVAPTRDVSDELTAETMRAFYDTLGRSDPPDVEEALRQAQLAVRREHPDSDWGAFRVIGR